MNEIKTYQHTVGESLKISDDSIPDAEFVTVNLERAAFSNLNLSTVTFEKANMECAEFKDVELLFI